MIPLINIDYNDKEDAAGWIEYCIKYSIGMMYVSPITWTIIWDSDDKIIHLWYLDNETGEEREYSI